MENLDYILNRGFTLFPCSRNGKIPITKNGFKDATRDKKIIEQWFKENPNANVGIPTGKVNGITVLDVDERHGGFYSLQDYDVPDTPYVETGGGGKHYYFKYTPQAKTGANRVGLGLDIRNDGGYVIAPPSIHKSGKKYMWCDEDLPFAEAPEWLFYNEFEKEYKKFKLPEGQIPQGEQDITLLKYTFSLMNQGLTPGLIRIKLKEIIGDEVKCPQDPSDPFTDKDIERWITRAFKHKNTEDKKKPEAVIYLNPVNCLIFKQQDIPEVQYYTEGIIQKKGRTMISAKNNMGKSFFLINLLASICSGQEKFLDNFENDLSKPRALYLDLEMGESALQERLGIMGKITDLDNLFVQSMYGWNMLDKAYQTAVENIIQSQGIKIIAFDPLGSLWFGDENKRESVKQLTDYFDFLLYKYGVSVCITHHWRKASKDFKAGGEMAAGSYGWGKWLDNHITLQGEINSLVINCEKSRNQKKWETIRLQLDEETLLFKNLGEFKNTKKFTDDDLLGLFKSFSKTTVTRVELIKRAKLVCSKSTVDRLLEDSKYIRMNKTQKPYLLYLAETQVEFGKEK